MSIINRVKLTTSSGEIFGPLATNGSNIWIPDAYYLFSYLYTISNKNPQNFTKTSQFSGTSYYINGISSDENNVWLTAEIALQSGFYIIKCDSSNINACTVYPITNISIDTPYVIDFISSDGTNVWFCISGVDINSQPINTGYPSYVGWFPCNDTDPGANVNTTAEVNNAAIGSISSDGTNVWVSNTFRLDNNVSKIGNSITQILCSTGIIIRQIQVIDSTLYPDSGPIGISSDGTYVWVAVYNSIVPNTVGSNYVAKIDCSTGEDIAHITVAGIATTVSSSGTYVAVGNNSFTTIQIINCNTNIIDFNVNNFISNPILVLFNNNNIWVCDGEVYLYEVSLTTTPILWSQSTEVIGGSGISKLDIGKSWLSLDCDATGQYVYGYKENDTQLYISQDFGKTWNNTNAPPSNCLGCIACSNNLNTQYNYPLLLASAAVNSGNLALSTDNGVSWNVIDWTSFGITNQGFHNITVNSDGTIITFSSYNSNTGTGTGYIGQGIFQNSIWTWTFFNAGTPATLPANANYAWADASDDGQIIATCIYSGGTQGNIYISRDQGSSWIIQSNNNVPNGGATGWYSITCSSDGNHIAACNVTENGSLPATIWTGVYNSNTNIYDWSLSNSSNTQGWIFITSDSSGQYLAACLDVAGGSTNLNGQIYLSYDYGSNWEIQTQALPLSNWYRVCISNQGLNYYAGGRYFSDSNPPDSLAYMYLGNYAGTSWQTLSNGLPTTSNWSASTSSSTGQYLAACAYDGTVYTSADNGVNWAKQTIPTNPQPTSLFSITSSSSGQYLAMAGNPDNNYIYTSNDYGVNWSAYPILNTSTSGYGIHNVVMSYPGTIMYVATCLGGIWKGTWSDGVWSFTQLTVNGNTTTPPTPNYSWIACSANGQFVSTCIYGGSIFTSNNGGTTWTEISGTSNSWYCMTMSNSGKYQYAAVLTGGLSGGNTNGGIYASNNFGANWFLTNAQYNIVTNSNSQQNTYRSYGFNSIICSGDGKTVIAVATTAVYISTDYGVNWIPQTTGLPSQLNWSSITTSSSGQLLMVTSGSPSLQGGICFSQDYGTSWTQFPTVINFPLPPFTYKNIYAFYPTGTIIAFLGTADPDGWVIMDGIARSNSSGIYNNLISMGIGTSTSTTYTPPDYQGAFLRGIGGNSGQYTLNAQQNDQTALLNHSHTITLDNAGATHSHESIGNAGSWGPLGATLYQANGPSGGSSLGYALKLGTGNVSTTTTGYTYMQISCGDASGSGETRPYNYGVNWILKQ